MSSKAKTADGRIEALRRKRSQIDARLALLAAREKAEARKRDARRKIIVGAAVLAHAGLDPFFRVALRELLRRAVTRPIDRAAILDLLAGSGGSNPRADASQSAEGRAWPGPLPSPAPQARE